MTKGLIDEGGTWGFRGSSCLPRDQGLFGHLRAHRRPLPQGTNAALCDVLVYWFLLWRKPPWETVFSLGLGAGAARSLAWESGGGGCTVLVLPLSVVWASVSPL